MKARHLRSPYSRFAFMLVLDLTLLLAAILFAKQQIRPSLPFEPQDILRAGPQSMVIEPLDLISEPGEISRDDELQRFFTRQDALIDLLHDPEVVLEKNGQTLPVTFDAPTPRALPLLFWIQIIVGAGAFAISAWIWSLRSRDRATRLFLLSGSATLLFTFSAAIYTTRGLALPSSVFRLLVAFNECGASVFGISMLALFTIHPFHFRQWRLPFNLLLLFFGLWTIGIVADWCPAWAGVNLLTLLEMICICCALAAQFYATRGHPTARASLTWLGLSVLMGAGFFIAFNAAPLVLGWNVAVEQGYAFLSFLFIYLGLAAGISRFRLFEVGHWAYRFLFHVSGAFLLLALDAVLIYALDWERLPALGFSFFLVALFYLPLRDFIGDRIRPVARLKPHELMEALLPVAFAPSASLQRENWQKLLGRIFDPLEMMPLTPAAHEVHIDELGLTLCLPGIGEIPSLKLAYPASGRALFSPESLQLARQIVYLMTQAEVSRKAYDRGVLEERRRMAQDLHDDVGARLLTALHQCDEKARPTLQAVMADIKELVGDMSGDGMSLGEVLADLRFESSRRLAAAGMDFEWNLSSEKELYDFILPFHAHKALRSGFREIVTNIIRHADASRVQVELQLQAACAQLQIRDDGKGIPQPVLDGKVQGYGLAILRKRLAELGGRVHVSSSHLGTSIQLSLPIGNSYSPPETGGDLPLPKSKLNPTGYSEREAQA
jgi:signal transduction histidine kinase